MSQIHLRTGTQADVKTIAATFKKSIQGLACNDYSMDQIEAWVKRGSDLETWNRKLATQLFLIAEIDEKTAGFGSMDKNGYIDYLFVDPSYNRQGVATAILHQLEASSTSKTLTTKASKTARCFFEHHGYRVMKENVNTLDDQVLINYSMEKLNLPFARKD